MLPADGLVKINTSLLALEERSIAHHVAFQGHQHAVHWLGHIREGKMSLTAKCMFGQSVMLSV